MAKQFSLIIIVMLASCVAFGQTTKPKLDEVKNDPKTTTNAAKADAQVVDKKTVTDKETLKTIFSKKRKMNARKRKSPYRRSA